MAGGGKARWGFSRYDWNMFFYIDKCERDHKSDVLESVKPQIIVRQRKQPQTPITSRGETASPKYFKAWNGIETLS